MRLTVCELPHEPAALAAAWAGLCRHTSQYRPDLVLLPEFAFAEAVWEDACFDEARWDAAVVQCDAWLGRLAELGAVHVVGTRPASIAGCRLNQGYIWSAAAGLVPLRSKFFLPDQRGNWEARWYDRGDPVFPAFHAGALAFGLSICTELWALETYGAYFARGVQVILSPRATATATAAKWLSLGVIGAVRSGAFSASSNRVDADGACGGRGWIISPQAEILATTSRKAPFATVDVDLAVSDAARTGYPCSVFG